MASKTRREKVVLKPQLTEYNQHLVAKHFIRDDLLKDEFSLLNSMISANEKVF